MTAEPALGPNDADESTLRMLLRMSRAIMGARRLEAALEAIAEESLVALGAASFSISRWERDSGLLRTLINVGDLGPGEQRWPKDESYPLAEYRLITDLLRHGRPYVSSIDDHAADSAAVALVRSLGKESELAVPIMCDGSMWGELWATGTDGRRFGPPDVELLSMIGSTVSAAIRTAEIFGEMSQYAYEDPLTGLANRRALDDRLHDYYAADVPVTLLIGDLDGLKIVNDRDGHPAGDKLLRDVADVLSTVSSTVPDALVVRMGGDEFCVLIPRCTLADAERLATEAARELQSETDTSVSLCWGAASRDLQLQSAHELIAAADAALVAAKREGPGRMRLHTLTDDGGTSWPARRTEHGRRALDQLVPRVVASLSERPEATLTEALDLLTAELCRVVNASGWATSMTTDDGDALVLERGMLSQRDSGCPLRLLHSFDDTVFPLARYPATARALETGTAFVASLDDESADPAEVALLRELGQRAVLVVGARSASRGYLLELYCEDAAPLAELAPHATVLLHYCVGRYSAAT
jgi:diguanylate cyclase (GGDEF)-like protein